jgi:predicted transcriptional regulator
MAEMVKFSSKMDAEVLRRLREHADQEHKQISGVLTDAVRDYLQRSEIRPAFRDAADQVINEHAELLERLAK